MLRVMTAALAEELGAVIQIRQDDLADVMATLEQHGLGTMPM